MAADGYILDPIQTDPDALEVAAYERLQSRWADWVPNNNDLSTWQISVLSRMVAEAMDVAADVPPAIFKFLGQSIFGIPPIGSASSRVNSTWVVADNAGGRTILAGWTVTIDDPVNGPVVFRVVSDVVLASGVLTTAAGAVVLEAVDAGTIADGLGGIGITASLYDPPTSWVSSVTLTGTTTGGANEEDDSTYLDRLRRRLTLLTPRPILPRDFEVLAVDIAAQNGIAARALALDGYDPVGATYSNERMIALFLINAVTGANVGAPIKSAVDAALQALREVNFVVTVNDPTVNTVDITAIGKALPGYSTVTVDDLVTASLQSYFSATNYGLPIDEAVASQTSWANAPIVRHQDVSAIINGTPGFDYWTTLLIGVNGGAQAATDQSLNGAAPITNPGVINVTIT